MLFTGGSLKPRVEHVGWYPQKQKEKSELEQRRRAEYSPLPTQADWKPTSSWPQEEMKRASVCVCVCGFKACRVCFMCLFVLSHAVSTGPFLHEPEMHLL